MTKITKPYYYFRSPDEVCQRLNEIMEKLGDKYVTHNICMAPSTQFSNEYFILFVTEKVDSKYGN